jgi:hypothetical protein
MFFQKFINIKFRQKLWAEHIARMDKDKFVQCAILKCEGSICSETIVIDDKVILKWALE